MKISGRKKLLLGLAATTLFTMTGCPADNDIGSPRGLIEDSDRPDVGNNQAPDVYGPPVVDPGQNEIEDVYGPPIEDVDPGFNEIEGVYGPPIGEIDPGMNEPVDVYGPPEWFDGGADQNGN